MIEKNQQKKDQSNLRRVNRILSLAGITSRRKADELIKSGKVKVNDRLVTEPGVKAIWGIDRICVNNKEIPNPSRRTYLMLNKPFGYICSFNDPEGRPLVLNLLKDLPERVYSVGRLDFDTIGLLLFTNDGEWSYRLTHPKYQVPRTYKVTVAGRISDDAVGHLRSGIRLEDGFSGKSKAVVVERDNNRSIVRITITRGKPRQVRRMLDLVGYKVLHLARTGFGNLMLGDLKVGAYRLLEQEEVVSMKRLVGLA